MEIFKKCRKISEPTNEGTNGQVLTTDGKGKRTWRSIEGFAVIDNLNTDDPNSGLSAKQGKVLNEKIEGITYVDNLISSDSTKGLSAKQGKVLDERITTEKSYLENKINTNTTNLNNLSNDVNTLESDMNTKFSEERIHVDLLSLENTQSLPKDSYTKVNLPNINNDFINIVSDETHGLVLRRKANSNVKMLIINMQLFVGADSNIYIGIKKNGEFISKKCTTATKFGKSTFIVPIESDNDYIEVLVNSTIATSLSNGEFTHIEIASFK